MKYGCCLLWVALGVVGLAVGCQSSGARVEAGPPPQKPTSPQPAPKAETPTAPKTQVDPLHPRVKIETTLGSILLALDAARAPATVLNFLQRVNDGFYDGTVFHRVIKDSMIQGGGYTPDMAEKTADLKPDVSDIWRSAELNKRGTVALIRDRRAQAGQSVSTQFYINVANNLSLDVPTNHGTFAVFGKVVGGEDTVEKIRNTPVGTNPAYAGGRSNVVPIKPVVIESVRLVSEFDAARAQAAVAAINQKQTRRAEDVIERLEKETGRKAEITESGVRFVDLAIGTGPSPLPTDTIQFRYHGTFLDGTVFESTFETDPVDRLVEALITGLQDGLRTMKEGGRRTMVIPPELGYGEGGIPGIIPQNATLVFEVELLAIR